jgi:hypothetical protein
MVAVHRGGGVARRGDDVAAAEFSTGYPQSLCKTFSNVVMGYRGSRAIGPRHQNVNAGSQRVARMRPR